MSRETANVRRRFLIVRTSALGDIVQSLPALIALRRQHPESKIAWAIDERFRSLLDGHPALDEVIGVRTRAPTGSGLLGPLAVWREARRRLLDFRPDTALDLMGNWKSATLCRLSGAAKRIGLARDFRREPASAVLLNRFVRPRGEHAVERSLAPALCKDLGGEPNAVVDFGADRLLARATLPTDWPQRRIGQEGFFVIHPGAGWANKEYPAAWWGAVAHQVHEATEATALVVTGPGEEALGEKVEAASQGTAVHLPVPKLPALAALQRNARLVLGGDTGPVHLAHALETPVLCLMGPTDPALHGPWQSPESVLVRPLPCSYCHKRLREPRTCMLQLPPTEIARAALERLRQDPERV